MKKLMLGTALLSVLSLPALAQDGLFRSEMTAGSVHASDLIGARIYASEAAVDADEYNGVQDGWNDIGEINDVIVSRDGKVDSVLVDIGGFLGMGERQVAVDMTALRFVSDGATADNADDWFLVMNANRAAIEGAPEWSMSMNDAPADAAATVAATEAAGATDPAMSATDGTATDPAMAATDGTATDPAVAADGTATADGTMREPMAREGYNALASTELTADMLKGATAYDANDANIGEVGELILADDGQVKEIVLDVGGFLGMGEKPVALKLDQVDILRQTDGSDVRVYVPMTKAELEAMPDYKM